MRTRDLAALLLRMTPDQERKLLSRLSRGGLIARVRQGLYLVPSQLPLGGALTPDEALALTFFVAKTPRHEDASAIYGEIGSGSPD